MIRHIYVHIPFARVFARTARFTKICSVARKHGDFVKQYCATSISASYSKRRCGLAH